jgi:hypothetical protein
MGNHPQLAARFRLVNYYNFPRYLLAVNQHRYGISTVYTVSHLDWKKIGRNPFYPWLNLVLKEYYAGWWFGTFFYFSIYWE